LTSELQQLPTQEVTAADLKRRAGMMEVAFSRAKNRARALQDDIDSKPEYMWAKGEMFAGALARKVARLDRKLAMDACIKSTIADGADLTDDALGNVAATTQVFDTIQEALGDLVGETTRPRKIQDENDGAATSPQ
jgi:hypothetical protein